MMQANFNFVYRSTADIIHIKYFLNLHLLAIDYHFLFKLEITIGFLSA